MADTRYPRCPEAANENGESDRVKWWLDDNEKKNGQKLWPPIQRRRDNEIRRECQRYWDKVWWARHMSNHGNPDIVDEVKSGRAAARAIEERWGKQFLEPGDAYDWGHTYGMMMALSWVLGADWEFTGDT